MSLVSYGESDDSSDEDSSDPRGVFGSELVEKNAPKLQNEVVKTTVKTEELRTSQKAGEKVESGVNNDEENLPKTKSIGNFFSSLPAPWMSSWTGKQASKKEETVKISIPVVEDSDSDDESFLPKPQKRQLTSSQKASGLFGLLPKPKHSVVVKDSNPNRPTTKVSNRPLIPDSLRRKQANQKTSTLSKKSTTVQRNTAKNQGSDDDEEEDGENVSFFSFENKDVPTTTDQTDKPETKPVNIVNDSNVLDKSTNNQVPSTNLPDTPSMQPIMLQDINSTTTPSIFPPISSNQDLITHQSYTDQKPEEYSGVENEPNQQYAYLSNQTDYGYNNYGSHDSEPYRVEQPGTQVGPLPASRNQLPHEFIKKNKGKRGRGEEEINIIDVNMDDQVGSSSDWKSHYRQDDTGYQPQSKKKGDMPSTQQRRKHQITYLAHQAKEMEWELRNQWARNSQTKRQTQSKYGF